MTDILLHIEKELGVHLIHPTAKPTSMYIDYHMPFVKRIWFQHGEYRVYLHKIEPCLSSSQALYHPHPWQSAIRIIKGIYEMGVGHSESQQIPATDCKLFLSEGTIYEMTEKNAWHYVRPINEPVYSLMVTGHRNNRKMPVEPKKDFRKLTAEEIMEILTVFDNYYKFLVSKEKIRNLIMQ
jgi:hypothetical protein